MEQPLPQIVDDAELEAQNPEPTDEQPMESEMPDIEPDDRWVPPSREEWEGMQKLLEQANSVIAEYINDKGIKVEETKGSAWESDPELKGMEPAEREYVTKQVRAVLTDLGIDPDEFKSIKSDVGRQRENERFRAFDAERQAVRAAHGAANVDPLDADIRKLMDSRPLSYEEAFLIAKARSDKSNRSKVAQTQAKAAQSKVVAQSGMSGLGARPATPINPVSRVSVSELSQGARRDLPSMMKAIEASGESAWEPRRDG